MPDQNAPTILDRNNPFLGQKYPARAMFDILPAVPESVLAMVIHCGPVSLPVMLTRKEAEEWHTKLGQMIEQMPKVGGLTVHRTMPPIAGPLAGPNGAQPHG